MPSIKKIKRIIDCTPIKQPIMLTSVHGMGKSQWLAEYLKDNDYEVITLFVGQMADAGDMIGLPDRTKIIVNDEEISVTKFCSPEWWPFDKTKKIALFFDELNRGKPEINQCLMNLVLNKEMNGKKLGELVRLFGAINPSNEDMNYEVNPMGSAFFDRWNCYKFEPTLEEWIDWAMDTKINNNVIGFISKHSNLLDPPQGSEMKVDTVYTSRRSWERISDVLKNDSSIIDDESFMYDIFAGIIGIGAAAAFSKFVKNNKRNISGGYVITNWDKSIENKIKCLEVQECVHLNSEIIRWFKDNLEDKYTTLGKQEAVKYAINAQKYISNINTEAMSEFFDRLHTAKKEGADWPTLLCELNPDLTQKYVEIAQKNINQ